jgi:metallo-beta-lactamase family protein
MHLVESGRRKVLLDCGLFRQPRGESRLRNRRFPFHPHQIDAVILTHAHVDHCGNVANLVHQGFAGPIFCTPPTRDLVAWMLADSARIQEEEAHTHRVVGHEPDHEPLYTRQDVQQTIEHCTPLEFGQEQVLFNGIRLRFEEAGHILGSAMVHLALSDSSRGPTLTFTGDLGRRDLPFLPEAAPIPPADLIVSESTYGGKLHSSLADMTRTLADVVHRTVARGGKVLIPAFSLGRTQVVVYYLRRWMADRLLPRLPIYVDSPLAVHIARIYEHYRDRLHPDVARSDGGIEDFLGETAKQWLRTMEESRAISTSREPCIIVASGGMCEAGRILRHLPLHVDDPRSSLVLVSYQAPGSLGRQLLEPRPTVRFLGRTWNKWIDVVEVNGFSGHADQNDFLAYFRPLAGHVRQVCLVHGETDQSEALAARLTNEGFANVTTPFPGETIALAS